MAAQTPLAADLAARVHELCIENLRPPSEVLGYPGPTRTLVFAPELDATEQATYDAIVAMARARITGLTLAEFQALAPALDQLRAFRDYNQSTFMALTATQRDRALFDECNALAAVIRALLRD